MKGYEILGDPVPLPSGMKRQSEEGKIDYLLVRDGPMFRRWATLLTNAVPKRGRRNWMKASGQEDLDRFMRGFGRHVEQWLNGEEDEDHAAAIIFNLNGAEYVKAVLAGESAKELPENELALRVATQQVTRGQG